MKFRRVLVIGLAAAVGLFGLFAYFVGSVSAVYDPLKTYRYTLTSDELGQRLMQAISTNPNLTFRPTDSTGTDKNNLDFYADIFVKVGTENYKFHIKYNNENSLWNSSVKSQISLIGAFDVGHNTGGYVHE